MLKRKDLLTSVICTAVFALVMAACGGNNNPISVISHLPFGGGGHALVSGSRTSAHVMPSGTGIATAAFFQTGQVNLAQSFDAQCTQYNLGTVPSGQFVAVPGNSPGACDFAQTVPDTSIGKKIHDPGAMTDLVADVILTNNQDVSCVDKTDTVAVTDGQLVRAFFDPNTGKAFVGLNNTATSLGCTVTIPAGSTIKSIEIGWVKQ